MARRLGLGLGLMAAAAFFARRPEEPPAAPRPAREGTPAPVRKEPPPIPDLPPSAVERVEPAPREWGLQAGDVVREVNGVAVREEGEIRILAARSWAKRGALRLTVDRGGLRTMIRLKRP